MSKTSFYDIPSVYENGRVFSKELSVTIGPEAALLKKEYSRHIGILANDPHFRDTMKKLQLDHYTFDTIRQEYVSECVSTCAYHLSMFGGIPESILLRHDLLSRMSYAYVLIHLAIAFGTGMVILDRRCAVVGIALGFDYRHLSTITNKLCSLHANQNIGTTFKYEQELNQACLSSHPFLDNFFIRKPKNASHDKEEKVQHAKKNSKTPDWNAIFFGTYAFVKPGYEKTKLQSLLNAVTIAIPYGIGYRHYCQVDMNNSLLSDAQHIPDICKNARVIELKDFVFNDGTTFAGLIKKLNPPDEDPVKINYASKLLSHARRRVFVIHYSHFDSLLTMPKLVCSFLVGGPVVAKAKL
ncbi:hypothetical protein RFI_11978 [Reticulomyxa filosa]|uniref:Uncharacterized protein n=1 Tax=Reticulomyxa filosa TaxID=46433 RepID=X6NGP3_RETFI|nr:hypothetical protein RFI_11978 [Reticulomyxa filosa]|eukprot:ETO25166.1 hypothetical protein RFI_11978 [Reticulomyxa filosa]